MERFNATCIFDCKKIEKVETSKGVVNVQDTEIIITQPNEEKITVGVKMTFRNRVFTKVSDNEIICEQGKPELIGDYKELSSDMPISEIIKAVNKCIDSVVEATDLLCKGFICRGGGQREAIVTVSR